MHLQTPAHPANVDCLMHSVDGFLVVAEMAFPKNSKFVMPEDQPEIKRIFGFFDNKDEMENFVRNSRMKIIAIKRLTVPYHDGQGMNYA